MPGELQVSALDDEQRAELVRNLLGARRLGRPPFLVRNLNYVQKHRREIQRSMWDVQWASSKASERARRRLSLTCVPARCTLPDSAIRRFQPKGAAAAAVANDAPQHGQGRVRIWLSAETVLGESVAFSVKEAPIRVWPRSHIAGNAPVSDIGLPQIFDMSAVAAFLEHRPARLDIVFELYAKKPAGLATAEPPVFRGVTTLMNKHASPSSSVLNKEYHVRLKPVDKVGVDVIKLQPAMGIPVKSEPQADEEGDTVMVPRDDESPIVMEDELELENIDGDEGLVSLELYANLDDDDEDEQLSMSKQKEILIECVYKSPAFPWWNGIVRHDFICPWCHRNCRRLRTLLLHFHLDHCGTELSLDSTQKIDTSLLSEAPFQLNLSVTPVAVVPKSNPLPLPVGAENLNANKDKYPNIVPNPVCETCPNGNGNDRAQNNDDGVLTDEEEMPIQMRKLINCQHCGRKHYGNYARNPRFCSEICEASGITEAAHTEGTPVDDLPLSKLSISRRRRIDFGKAFGDKTLYHAVSLVPFLESHFDEDGPDSEDEIDDSWRLQIVEDKIAALKGPCARSRVLWTMWNRYAHENYPHPGAYAERYTRYSVELFVLEYASEIKRLKLRLYLAAFLRVLHIHGCIDSEAWLSIMYCLDGKRKRRDIAVSARPEENPVIDPKKQKSRKRR